jgi:hypothetical protein
VSYARPIRQLIKGRFEWKRDMTLRRSVTLRPNPEAYYDTQGDDDEPRSPA